MATDLSPLVEVLYTSLSTNIDRLSQLEVYKAQTELHLKDTLSTIDMYREEIKSIKCLLCKFYNNEPHLADSIEENKKAIALIDCESCPRKTTCTHRH
jgi:hypothetical protein